MWLPFVLKEVKIIVTKKITKPDKPSKSKINPNTTTWTQG